MPNKERISFFLILICTSLFLYLTHIGCPIMYFTGISCPSCGMTRACLRMLTLDFSGAIQYHPLCFTVPFLILIILIYERIPKKLLTAILMAILVLFFAVYFMRLADPADPVVVINISSGKFYQKIMKPLWYLIEKIG